VRRDEIVQAELALVFKYERKRGCMEFGRTCDELLGVGTQVPRSTAPTQAAIPRADAQDQAFEPPLVTEGVYKPGQPGFHDRRTNVTAAKDDVDGF